MSMTLVEHPVGASRVGDQGTGQGHARLLTAGRRAHLLAEQAGFQGDPFQRGARLRGVRIRLGLGETVSHAAGKQDRPLEQHAHSAAQQRIRLIQRPATVTGRALIGISGRLHNRGNVVLPDRSDTTVMSAAGIEAVTSSRTRRPVTRWNPNPGARGSSNSQSLPRPRSAGIGPSWAWRMCR